MSKRSRTGIVMLAAGLGTLVAMFITPNVYTHLALAGIGLSITGTVVALWDMMK